jgi:phosphopantetheine--protein transferase-like protein
MDEARTIEYLSRLLNRPVDVEGTLVLTSGQRARLISWAEHFGGLSAQGRALVSGGFTLRQLLGDVAGAAKTPAAATPGVDGVSRGPAATFCGMGIDMQRIAEVVPYDDAFDFRSAADLARIFTAREISYACARQAPAQTLAGLFAAKEAIMKADPEKASRQLDEIEVLPGESGAPTYPGFQLSISHSGEYAVAIAMRVGTSPPARATDQPGSEPAAPPASVSVATSQDTARGSTKVMWLCLWVLAVAATAILWVSHA